MPNSLDRRFLLVSAAALAASGCGSLIGPEEGQKIYVLRPPLQKMEGPHVTWRLAVPRPDAPDSLDSRRISISRTANTMDYYADAVWPDKLAAVVQDVVVEAFEQSDRIAAVAPDTIDARADYSLILTIRDFEARYDTLDGVPTGVVRMHAKLVSKLGSNILGDLETAHEAPATANSIDAAVLALDTAFGATLTELVEWTLRTGVHVPA